jgi:phosphohistidine phosphatase
MKLLIVRHADAGDQAEFAKTGEPDSLRPLSPKGREQMQAGVDGFKKLVPSIDLIVTSPYTRAVQTAEMVRTAYGEIPLEQTDTLEPDVPPAEFATWLRALGEHEVVAAVGHEPHLGILTTWLMAGTDESRVELKKGGACLLYFEKRVRKDAGILEWLMGPKQLKALG